MSRVLLGDGTVLAADIGITTGRRVMWIWMRDTADPNNDLTRLAQLLSKPGAAETITLIDGGERVEYTGFSRLTSVRIYQAGLVAARMEKEADDV